MDDILERIAGPDGMKQGDLLPSLLRLKERAHETARVHDLYDIDRRLAAGTPEAYVYGLISMRWRAAGERRRHELTIIDDALGLQTFVSSTGEWATR